MSQPPYAAPPPHPGASGPWPDPRGAGRPRPRRRWFVVGAALLLAALVVLGVGLWRTLGAATATDAVVDATSSPATAAVVPGVERMLFAPPGQDASSCRVLDGAGDEVPLDTSSRTTTTVTTQGRTWIGVGTFTSPTRDVTVDCSAAQVSGPVRVGDPLGAEFAVGLAVSIVGPLLLGGAGLVVLVTTTVLWFSRQPRVPTSAPTGRPGPAGPPGPPAPPSPPPTGR